MCGDIIIIGLIILLTITLILGVFIVAYYTYSSEYRDIEGKGVGLFIMIVFLIMAIFLIMIIISMFS